MDHLEDLELDDAVTAGSAVKIVVNQAKLLGVLANACSIVEKKNISTILSNIRFVAKQDLIEISSSDLNILFTETIHAEVSSECDFAVNAQTFFEVVKKLSNAYPVEIELIENKRLKITSGKCKFTLPVLGTQDFPVMNTGVIENTFEIQAVDLNEIFHKTKFSMAPNDARINLNGIFVHQTKNELGEDVLSFVSSDIHRLSRFHYPLPEGASGVPDIILPKKIVLEFGRVIEGQEGKIKISLNRQKIMFEFKNITYISKLVEASFPDYTQIIPQNNTVKIKVNRVQFANAVDRVAAVAFEKAKGVRIELKDDNMVLIATGFSSEYGKEYIPIEYSGEHYTIGFNVRFLLDVTECSSAEDLVLSFASSNQDPVIINESEDETDSLFLIMPISL